MKAAKIEKKLGYYESFDGHQIYFESWGKGEPIVFVYGIACLINHWHHQIDYFSREYRTIVLDLRGHHKTAKPINQDALNIASLGRDLKALLEHLNLQQAHFVGHSFGAQVLLSAYQAHPEIFSTMTFINGFASNPIKEMFGLGVVDKIYHFFNTNFKQNPNLWTNLWRLSVESPLAIPLTSITGGFNLKLTSLKDIQVYAKGVANMDLEVFLRLFEELMNFDGRPILPTIECPVLVISGENDKVTPVKFQREMSQSIRTSEFLVVPYGSHCTQLDFPDYINLKLEKFFEQHR